jgi:primary-amine oxidase
MPVDYAKFTLKPYGFFGRNPTLNVPSSESLGMACHTDASGDTDASARGGACHCAPGACTCSGHGHGH